MLKHFTFSVNCLIELLHVKNSDSARNEILITEYQLKPQEKNIWKFNYWKKRVDTILIWEVWISCIDVQHLSSLEWQVSLGIIDNLTQYCLFIVFSPFYIFFFTIPISHMFSFINLSFQVLILSILIFSFLIFFFFWVLKYFCTWSSNQRIQTSKVIVLSCSFIHWIV